MADIPETRYVKSDDVHIAYQVLGQGPLDLLFVQGFVSHIEAIWQSPQASDCLRRLASFCRLIIFDKRGVGMSDRGSQIFTLEQRMHDVQAVLDAVESRAGGAVRCLRRRTDVASLCCDLPAPHLGPHALWHLCQTGLGA